MRNAATKRGLDAGAASSAEHPFSPNDVVLVQQLKKTSHEDRRFVGSKRWTGRALVVAKSQHYNHYQIQWISQGLIGKEKAGAISRQLWLPWRLKTTPRLETDPVLNPDTTSNAPPAQSKATRASASSRSSTSHVHTAEDPQPTSDDIGEVVTPRKTIPQIAARYVHARFHCALLPFRMYYLCWFEVIHNLC